MNTIKNLNSLPTDAFKAEMAKLVSEAGVEVQTDAVQGFWIVRENGERTCHATFSRLVQALTHLKTICAVINSALEETGEGDEWTRIGLLKNVSSFELREAKSTKYIEIRGDAVRVTSIGTKFYYQTR